MADLPKGVVWDPEETYKGRHKVVKRPNRGWMYFGALFVLMGIIQFGEDFSAGVFGVGLGALLIYLYWRKHQATQGGAFAAAGGRAIIDDREIVECPSCGLRTMNGQRHRFGEAEVTAEESYSSMTGPGGRREIYTNKIPYTVPDSRRVHLVDCPKCSTDLEPTKTGVIFPSNRDARVRCSNCGTMMTLGRWSDHGGELLEVHYQPSSTVSARGDEVNFSPRDVSFPNRPFWMEFEWTASGSCPNCNTIAVPEVIEEA